MMMALVEIGTGYWVGDKVELVRRLGSGGMGEVWLAQHHGLQTDVAVKFVSREHAGNPEATARFKREAAAAAKIKSPHVVQILDHGTTKEGLPFIVMERLEGEDLAARIHRAGPLPVAFVCDVAAQVLKALSRAHKLGIVHRDVKPENIFVCEHDGDRVVKVLDFGIAKNASEKNPSMTSTGVALGSPYYMSPEQVLSAKNVDPRSDLWAVGIVAYQAMTGKLPFTGETVGALAIAINDGNYRPASQTRPGIPAAIDAWIARALMRDVDARFQSAREMAQALQRAIQETTKGEFTEAPTDVGPIVETDPAARGSLSSLTEEPPDTTPIEPDPAQSAALGRTHLTATLSVRGTKSRTALAFGVAVGVLLVGGAAVFYLVAAWLHHPPIAEAEAASPAATVSIAPLPPTPVTPTQPPAGPVGVPTASVEAAPSAQPTEAAHPHVRPRVPRSRSTERWGF